MNMIISEEENKKQKSESKPKRKAFAYWEVGNETYKLKLTTSAICSLEEKFKTNLLNLTGDDNGLPPLSNILYITHAAMKDWHHSTSLEDVKTLYSQYVEDGGSLLAFYTDIFMSIYRVSGFFTQSQAATMEKELLKAKEEM